MNFWLLPILVLYICTCVIGQQRELDYDGWLQIRLFHALNNDPVPHFTERGNITVTSIRTGASTMGQLGLQDSQKLSLKKLAENGSKYRLKAIVKSSSGSESTFLTSVPACHLLGTELEDVLTIWVNLAAEPISLSQVTPGPCSFAPPTTNMWTTNVQVKFPDGGPTPDTASYIFKMESEKEAKDRGESKDNRSFFAKYWMYIVPALIFLVLTSAVNPEAGGTGGGNGGGGQRQ